MLLSIKSSVVISLILLLMFSCQKEEEKQLFEPGLIYLDFEKTVDIQGAFELVNNENLAIKSVHRLSYSSQLPIDSVMFVEENLKTQNYVASASTTVGIEADKIVMRLEFHQMCIDSQKDWLVTMNTLQLVDLKQKEKKILVIVPIGTEIEWVKYFEKSHRVAMASPSYYLFPS